MLRRNEASHSEMSEPGLRGAIDFRETGRKAVAQLFYGRL